MFAYAKTKTQISFAVTAKLISAFVFATRIVRSLYFLNTEFQASSCTAPFMWDLVGNPEDRFSQNEAHFGVTSVQRVMLDVIHIRITRPCDVNHITLHFYIVI